MPGEPRGVDLSISGDTLLVARADTASLMLFDPDGVRAPKAYPLTALDRGFAPIAVRVAADGVWLVHAERPDGNMREVVLLAVDPRTSTQTILAQQSPGDAWGRLVASGDRSKVVTGVSCLRVYDSADGTLGPCGRAADVRELVADGAGTLFADRWFTLDAELSTLHADHPIGDQVEAVGFTPGGERLLAVNAAGIHVIDMESWLPVRFLAAELPTGRVAVTADGSAAIVWGRDEARPSETDTPLARVELTGLLPP